MNTQPLFSDLGNPKQYVGKGKANGYYSLPGSGPEGETCRTCNHYVRIHHARVYRKCLKNEAKWTKGKGSDILASAPACSGWEAQS